MGRRKIPLHHEAHELELDERGMRELGEAALERVIAHLGSLPEQPVSKNAGGRKLATFLQESMPERGTPFERLLRILFGRVLPVSLNTASPGYLAYIPGGGLFQSAIADFIALATNRYVGVWLAAPGLVQLETNVLSWFAAMLGMPSEALGLFTTGGSMANLIAIVTARRLRFADSFAQARLYVSDQAHHSVLKSAIFAGFSESQLRVIASDAEFRMNVGELEKTIESDRAAGGEPFLIVASAGTTNTGAVDDLDALASIANAERLWLHVDAAYGGFFALTSRGKRALRGIERADSVTLDPHKSLFLPYGTGCLLVRDRQTLRRAHSHSASYMPHMQSDADLVDFCEMGPELSREARGLRAWLPLKLHGAVAFRRALDEKLDLCQLAFEQVALRPNIEIVARPELSLFAFRLRPAQVESEALLEALNRELLGRINAPQRVFLTGATSHDGFFLRVCVLSFRTHQDRIDALLQDLDAALAELEKAGFRPRFTPERKRPDSPGKQDSST